MAFHALPQPPAPQRSKPLSSRILEEDDIISADVDLDMSADANNGDDGDYEEDELFDCDPFEPPRSRKGHASLTPVSRLGAVTSRDLMVARALGHTASEFEALFKTNALGLIIQPCAKSGVFSAQSQELFEWALSTGANANELAKTQPDLFLRLMSIDLAGARQGALMLSSGASLPSSLPFTSAARLFRSSSSNCFGGALHKLFSDYRSSPTLVETALALADGADLAQRDSEGLSICGRLNQELARAPDSSRSAFLRAFAALVSLGADPSDLSPCPTCVAADPAIARAAQVSLERKALLNASAGAPRAAPTRL